MTIRLTLTLYLIVTLLHLCGAVRDKAVAYEGGWLGASEKKIRFSSTQRRLGNALGDIAYSMVGGGLITVREASTMVQSTAHSVMNAASNSKIAFKDAKYGKCIGYGAFTVGRSAAGYVATVGTALAGAGTITVGGLSATTQVAMLGVDGAKRLVRKKETEEQTYVRSERTRTKASRHADRRDKVIDIGLSAQGSIAKFLMEHRPYGK